MNSLRRENIAIIAIFACFLTAQLHACALSQDPANRADAAQTVEFKSPIPSELVSQGWMALFDGSTLFGWKSESRANWQVVDGAIVVDSGELGLLRTTSQFSDFELSLEFKADRETNSGVFVRTSPRPTDPTVDCYEINIAPAENPFPTASIVGRSRAVGTGTAPEEFNRLSIIARTERIRVRLNGQLVTEYRDQRPLGRGFIGLQYNSGAVRFRNIWLRPLNLDPILGDGGLDRWRRYPDMEGRFEITRDGYVHATGGPGQLESKSQFADFILQLQAKTIGTGQNSGVFFRCIPGEQTNGYESQIDHSILGGDRNRPANFGTGGIFRRQPARRVMSADDEWFSKTIVAGGPHISVWVNGFQVVDWSDTRAPDPNPRRGRRLQAGTIMLQAHDPATNVMFRALRVSELSPRGR